MAYEAKDIRGYCEYCQHEHLTPEHVICSNCTEDDAYAGFCLKPLDRFESRFGPWNTFEAAPVEDWQEDVVNNNTRLGYRLWAYNQIRAALTAAGVNV